MNSDATHYNDNLILDQHDQGSGNNNNIVIEAWMRKEQWFIVSVYKPPPANVNVFISELSQMWDQLYHESDNIILFDTGLSDFHKIICVCTKVYVPWEVPRKIVYRCFKSFDENKYKEDISMTPFHVSYIFDDTDDVVLSHNKLLSDVVDIHAPLKQRMLKKDKCSIYELKTEKGTIPKKSTHKSVLGLKKLTKLGSK